MKRHTAAITLMFGAVLSILPLQAQTKAHRVLFAMTSPEEADWQLTLNNIRNLISGMAPDPVEIELVAYGPGIAFLKKDGTDAAEILKLESTARSLHRLRQRHAKTASRSPRTGRRE
jgi:hypothetical protein